MQQRESSYQFEPVYPSHDAMRAVDLKRLREKRQGRFRDVMNREDLDGLLLTATENARYVSDVRPVHSVYFTGSYQALLTEESLVVLAPAGDVPRIDAQMPWVDEAVSTSGDAADLYADLVTRYSVENLGVDSLDFTIADRMPDLTPVGDSLARERGVKFPEEVAILDDAGALCEVAVLKALDAVEQGAREYEVAAAAEHAAKREGAQGVSWNPATFSGTNTGLFLRYDSEKRIRYGDFVVLGYAFVYEGYNMDITVTTVAGEPDREQREVYSAVWDAREAAINAVEPGATAREVRDAAHAVIDDRGFGDHSFVDYQPIFHGLGMNVYEPPFAPEAGEDEPNDELETGHVLVPEPGIYFPEEPSRGGVRIGEPVLVTDEGSERLAQVVPDRHEGLYIGEGR
ncbi:M24 family metallopeptidase [Halorussus salinisoli]|uniref:M24 family metallopeptidase n=1 Tax=Halorussus salinisoli TaxID=2558242 RepID=UPI0010C1BD12|nr:Xaa-Pro peptidase family protein [Halorussus salinisoli]